METNYLDILRIIIIFIIMLPICVYLLWCKAEESLRPWIENRKRWLSQKFAVNVYKPLFQLEDGRKILSKRISLDYELCIMVEKNWKLCDNKRQEFDCILYDQKKEYDHIPGNCVIVCKNYTEYGVFNTELKKIIVPVEYTKEQLCFYEEKGVYILIAPYADKAFTYEGESVHPW